MVLILDDEQLESLQCSRCRKYLSVFPVKNHSSREVTCGRCSSDDENGVRSHLYELIAQGYLFRCVNRYEGCTKLLRADEAVAHELECVGRAFRCPKCDDSVERSILELIWHYKLEHPSSYLKGNRFNVKPHSEDVMLYVQGDVVFFIRIWYVSNALYVNLETLTKVNVTQALFVSKGRIWEKTKGKPCMVEGDPYVFHLDSVETINVIFSLEVSKSGRLYDITLPSTSMGTQQELTVQLSTSLQKELGYKLNDHGTALFNKIGHEIDLTCSNCKQFIRQSVFRCVKSNHQICHNCRAWCGICNCSVKSSLPDDLLIRINLYLKYPCRWKCGGYYASDLDAHESTCKLKVLKCPKCPFEVDLSALTLMKTHLVDNHQIINFCKDYEFEQIKSFIERNHNGKVYFLFHDKCCYLKWLFIDKHYDRSYRGVIKYYNFNFGLFDNEPNIELNLVYNLSSISCNTLEGCPTSSLSLYLPYVNLNQTNK